MTAFDYLVLNQRGKQEKGTLEGDSARQVRQQLREKGLMPISVEPTVELVSANGKGVHKATTKSARYRLSSLDLALLTRQLATLVQAGMTVEGALKAVSKQSEKQRLKSIILAVRSKVVEGHSLANSFQEFPKAFPEIYRATVAAGEQSGHLDLVLSQLADYTESSHDTSKKVKGALIYPSVLTGFSVLIVVALLKFVVPKMVSVFENSGQDLPLLTQLLIGFSEFIQDYGLYVLLLFIAAVFAFRQSLKKDAFRLRWHQFVLKLPLVSRLVRLINAARVANTLSILSRSGVQLVDALRIAGQVATNLCIRAAVEDAAGLLKEGSSLHKALDKSDYFPPLMIQMIASGESSGELDNMLARAAQAQERELEGMISTIVSLFEPMMMVVMGLVVLTIVLAIMLPVISLNTLVG